MKMIWRAAIVVNNPRFLQILEEARQRIKQTGGMKSGDFWKAR